MYVNNTFHHIRCPFQRPGYFTGVVAILADNITLIDTGLKTSPQEAIIPYLAKFGRSPVEITNIILTHTHGDHFEGIPSILQQADARIFVHELEKHRVINLATQNQFNPSRIESVKNGDILTLSDRQLEIFHCPGHSAGSICIIDRDTQVSVTGDSVQGQGEERPLLFFSSIAYANSINRLSLQPISVLMLGHPFPPYMKPVLEGVPVKEFFKASLNAVYTLRDRLFHVLNQSQRPLSILDFSRLMPDVRPPSILPILDELVIDGKARVLGRDAERLWIAK